jgi:hypothetical protein
MTDWGWIHRATNTSDLQTKEIEQEIKPALQALRDDLDQIMATLKDVCDELAGNHMPNLDGVDPRFTGL